jgi:FkbM family methyltransferase
MPKTPIATADGGMRSALQRSRVQAHDLEQLPFFHVMTKLRRLAKALPGAKKLYASLVRSGRLDRSRDWLVTHAWRDVRRVNTPLGFVLYAPRFRANVVMQAGTFEPQELQCLQELLGTCDRLIDVGANIGWYACVARSACRPVLAIEPQRDNLDCLYRTLVENGWGDTEVVPMGLGASPGVRVLYGASGTGASLIPGWAGYSPGTQQRISITTLDALLDGRFHGERLLIKVDVEGAEYDVLRGAILTLRRRPRPRWMVEVCLQQHHPGGNQHFADTFDLFREEGYDACLVDSARTPVSDVDIRRWVDARQTDLPLINYLFTHRGSAGS